MKKILVLVIFVVFAIGSALYLVTKASDSYELAVDSIQTSEVLSKSLGLVKYYVLIGANYKLQPKTTSCGSLKFIVTGSKGAGLVEVLVKKRDFHGSWEVYNIVEGLYTISDKSCSYQTTQSTPTNKIESSGNQ